MSGTHSVYQELRKNAATGQSNTHSTFLLQTHGIDVILRPGVIQYRAVCLSPDLILSSHLTRHFLMQIGGTLDFYFFSGDSNATTDVAKSTPNTTVSINSAVNAIAQYIQIIGLPQVPPAWAFGFHLSRWGYNSLDETRDIVKRMKDANIPLEAQWNDIDWMHAYRWVSSSYLSGLDNAYDCPLFCYTIATSSQIRRGLHRRILRNSSMNCSTPSPLMFTILVTY